MTTPRLDPTTGVHLSGLPTLLSYTPSLRHRLETWIRNFSRDDDTLARSTMEEVLDSLYHAQKIGYGNCAETVAALESILVTLMGHSCEWVRENAIVALNVLYDGHSLQKFHALPVAIACVGEQETVFLPASTAALLLMDENRGNKGARDKGVERSKGDTGRKTGCKNVDGACNRKWVVRMFEPDPNLKGPPQWAEYNLVKVVDKTGWECKLPPFATPGYYDWMVTHPGGDTPAAVDPSVTWHFIESQRRLSGRFIVHPKGLREAHIVEVPVDEVGAAWNEKTGQLQTRGSFDATLAKLPEIKMGGATAVYLMGALERAIDEHGTSPFAVVDREQPASLLGGQDSFANLVEEIHRLGMTAVVDGLDRVSRTRMHRKYRYLMVETLTDKGIPLRHPGTDGRENQWEDTALLNYRRVEAWNLLISETKTLASRYGVRGVRLDNAQSLPPILEPDMEELLRRDSDGVAHYSLSEIFYGAVVKRNEEFGYWKSFTAMERNYPNPFLIKFTRELWNTYPDFIVFAEAHFHRESLLMISGAIPHSIRIPQIIASISGKSLRRDGAVSRLPLAKRSTARTLSRLYRNDKYLLPKHPIMLNCTCTHLSPYPGVLYGRRAWLIVDLVCLLPEIPMLLFGEEQGKSYRMNMAPVLNTEEYGAYDVNYDAVLPKSPKKSGAASPADSIAPYPPLSLSAAAKSSPSINGLASMVHTHQQKPSSPGTAASPAPPLSPLPGLALTGSVQSLSGALPPRLKRKGSMADLRRSPSISALVRSRSRDDMKGLSVRSVSADDFGRMRAMDEKTRQEIGPEGGYDIAQIKGHYTHRQLLRQQCPVFRSGGMCVLTVDPQRKEQVFAFARFSVDDIRIIVINTRDSKDGEMYAGGCDVELDMRPLWDALPLEITATGCDQFYRLVDGFTGKEYMEGFATIEELIFRRFSLHLNPLATVLLRFEKVDMTKENAENHIRDCLHRLQSAEAADMKDAREIHLIATLCRGASRSMGEFGLAMDGIRKGLVDDGVDDGTIAGVLQMCIQRASQLHFLVTYEGAPGPKDFTPPASERIVAYLSHLATASKLDKVMDLSRALVSRTTKLGPLVFLTAELGRFSTAGGLGVMVDELTKDLAAPGLEVYVISPYYTVNRKNKTGYLGTGITWQRNIFVNLGTHEVEVGVFEGKENGVNLIFLERGDYFPKVYADPGGAVRHLQTVVLMSLGSLEACASKGLKPALVVTNDWLPALASGYKHFFGDFFSNTSFFHLIHNLGDGAYEGRCFPNPQEGALEYVHRLPRHLLVNSWWDNVVVNPSRCALITSDSWGTVSPNYLKELLADHPLKDLLQIAKSPFAYPNGIRKREREELLISKGAANHLEAKELIQKRYFGFQEGDPSIPLFSFVGRITSQKGVHLIINAVDELIAHTAGKIQILVGGPANYSDSYSAACARHMHDLRRRHPWCFWAGPDEFFTDGPLVNLGSDFGLMPSLFEPGGIVQHEYFVAGTPVIAYRTGGLKDTVHEWMVEECEGNGFTFESYTHGDFVWAVKRAIRVFSRSIEYEELRQSAYETTIDVSQVAWAWSSEFHRLRNAMFTREEVVRDAVKETIDEECGLFDPACQIVTFKYKCAPDSKVVLKGSFDAWTAEWPLHKEEEGTGMEVSLRVKPGEYMYKFRVNGKWTVADDQETKHDEGGFLNNCIKVG